MRRVGDKMRIWPPAVSDPGWRPGYPGPPENGRDSPCKPFLKRTPRLTFDASADCLGVGDKIEQIGLPKGELQGFFDERGKPQIIFVAVALESPVKALVEDLSSGFHASIILRRGAVPLPCPSFPMEKTHTGFFRRFFCMVCARNGRMRRSAGRSAEAG